MVILDFCVRCKTTEISLVHATLPMGSDERPVEVCETCGTEVTMQLVLSTTATFQRKVS